MSWDERMSLGVAILSWWGGYLGEREAPHSRALSARLRRASAVESLCEGPVHRLSERLVAAGANPRRARDPERLVTLVRTLAEVRADDARTLAQRLGGANPAMSELRFRRMLRAEGEDLTNALRRAVGMAGHRCDVAALGRDILFWGDNVRIAWTFHYHGAEAPARVTETSE